MDAMGLECPFAQQGFLIELNQSSPISSRMIHQLKQVWLAQTSGHKAGV